MMSIFLALVILGSCTTGAIAISGEVESNTIRELEKRLNSLESSCVTQSNFNQRFANLERRQNESKMEAEDLEQKTDQRFAEIQGDSVNILNKMTERHKEKTKASKTKASKNKHAKRSHPLNESLKIVNSIQCKSGVFGNSYSLRYQSTLPRLYRLDFDPPFENRPQLTFGINYLVSPNVGVKAKAMKIKKSYATISVSNLRGRSLHGIKFSWMACP